MNTTTIHSMRVSMAGKNELRLVAMRGERLIGVASVANFGSVAPTIYQLFVEEEARGAGIGRALVEVSQREAEKHGAMVMGAIIEPSGPKEFWSDLGFKPAHVDGGNLLVTRPVKG